MTPDEFRVAGHALVDWIADYRTRVPTLRVQSQVAPGDISAKMPASAPATPQPFGSLIEDLDRVVVPGITQVQHPMHFGWFPANVSMASVLGDLASTGIGALGISWQSAPALTEIEEVTCAWMRDEVGLSDAWHGTIHDTASTACLVAMLLARERVAGHGQKIGGLQALDRPLVVYTSSQAHSSVAKAVLLAGFGRSNLREIDVDTATRAMRPAALEAALAADAAAGRIPARRRTGSAHPASTRRRPRAADRGRPRRPSAPPPAPASFPAGGVVGDRGVVKARVAAERLRAENARLLRLLNLTRREAAPPGPAQTGLFEASPGAVHAGSPPDEKVA